MLIYNTEFAIIDGFKRCIFELILEYCQSSLL